jgi:hypothetical protein
MAQPYRLLSLGVSFGKEETPVHRHPHTLRCHAQITSARAPAVALRLVANIQNKSSKNQSISFFGINLQTALNKIDHMMGDG